MRGKGPSPDRLMEIRQRPTIRAVSPGSEPIWADFEDEEGWAVSVEFRTVRGRFAAVGLRMTPAPGTEKVLTRAALERIKLSGLISRGLAQLLRLYAFELPGTTWENEQRQAAQTELIKHGPAAVGRPREDAHLRDVARRCIELQDAGQTRGVFKRIAADFTRNPKDPVPEVTARDWVRRARKRGILRPGQPGKLDFQPGPRFLEEEL